MADETSRFVTKRSKLFQDLHKLLSDDQVIPIPFVTGIERA
jgi:hypothetical protein